MLELIVVIVLIVLLWPLIKAYALLLLIGLLIWYLLTRSNNRNL